MAKRKKIVKRKINAGLKAWNDARSYISKQNKLLGNKFNGVELNELTRGALLEQYGQTFDINQVEVYLKQEVKEFYYNILDVSLSDLSATPFYMMDNKIQSDMPKGIYVEVNGGVFGTCSFNTFDYEYESSGLRDIVEEMREQLYGKNETPSPKDNNEQFDGFLRIKSGAKKDSKNKEDYFIEWVLFIDDDYVSVPKGIVAPAEKETRKILPKDVFKKNKGKLTAKKKKEIEESVKSKKKTSSKVSKAIIDENEDLKKQLAIQQSEIDLLKKQMAELLKRTKKSNSPKKPTRKK